VMGRLSEEEQALLATLLRKLGLATEAGQPR
jgi:hypothetical protein